jgi:hypothetical protein
LKHDDVVQIAVAIKNDQKLVNLKKTGLVKKKKKKKISSINNIHWQLFGLKSFEPH